VALTVGISLVAISILASTAGGTLPILFERIGFDPALMSAPFITTIVDVLGVLLYLTLARHMLGLA
jgi:magnesium transporter